MSTQKPNYKELSPVSESSSRPAFHHPDPENYICLSNAPSTCSIESANCCSTRLCTPETCHAVKLCSSITRLSEFKADGQQTQEGECVQACCSDSKANDRTPLARISIHTPNDQNLIIDIPPCVKINRSTPSSLDKLKKTASSSQEPCAKCCNSKPTSGNINNIHLKHKSQADEMPLGLSTGPKTSQLSNMNHRTSQNSLNEDVKPFKKEVPRTSTEYNTINNEHPASKKPSISKSIFCQKPSCSNSCMLQNQQNNDENSEPGNSSSTSSKIRAMPPIVPTLKRQGSNIARNASQILSAALAKKKEKKSSKKGKGKESKTSINSNVSSVCKCSQDMKKAGCSCHYPPAFSHYFQCTGTITGVCCCSENK